jgi:hypothetical protein
MFGPGLHIRQVESLFERRLRIRDSESIVGDLKNEVWGVATKTNGDDGRLGMANGVAHCFLSDAEEVLLDRGRQAFFGYAR